MALKKKGTPGKIKVVKESELEQLKKQIEETTGIEPIVVNFDDFFKSKKDKK